MFGLDFWELAIIFVVALIALGPKRLPEVAKSLGGLLAEFRKASTDLRRSIDDVARSTLVAPPTTPERPEPAPALPPEPARPSKTAPEDTTAQLPPGPKDLHG